MRGPADNYIKQGNTVLMSRAVNKSNRSLATLEAIYRPIRAEMDLVEKEIDKELSSDQPFINRMVRHGVRMGGKRLRPALVLFSGHACGKTLPIHIKLATSVELIHTATLVHDDVLDEADMRRHLETVNARWDNEASILLGDYILAQSIRLAAAAETPFACRAIGTASHQMCEGELRQIASRGNYALSEEEYFAIVTGKTAQLCACCCRIGAHYAGADEATQELLADYGRDLGIAFQIADDLLDLLGDEAVAGKSLGTDLVKQKTTLPLIRLLQELDETDRKKVIEILGDSANHCREVLKPWFDRTDAVEYAQARARDYLQSAIDRLAGLEPSEAVASLHALAEFAINRDR